MGFFGPPNVEKLKAKKDIKGLVKALGYQGDYGVRINSAKALGELGDSRAIPGLVTALKDQDNIRQAAVRALGQIGDPQAITPLISSVDRNSKTQHQTAVVESLSKIGNTGVDVLLSSLKWEKDYVRRRVIIITLGNIKDARAVKPLIDVLDHDNLRDQAIEALGKLGARATSPLIAALKDKNSNIRKAASQALGKIGGKSAVTSLISMLDDRYAGELAANSLSELRWKPGKDAAGAAYWIAKRKWDNAIKIGEPAVAPLVNMVKHSVISGNQGAIKALIQIGAPAVEALIAVLSDKDDIPSSVGGHEQAMKYAQEAVQALGEIGDKRAVEPLLNELKFDLDSSHPFDRKRRMGYNIAIIKALGDIGDAQAIEPLLVIFNGKVGELNQAAAEALGKLGWQPDDTGEGVSYWVTLKDWDRCVEFGELAVEPLIRFMTYNKYSEESKKVGNALVRIGKPAVKHLIKVLPDLNACQILGQIGDIRAVEPLIHLLKHSEKTTRKAAAEALVVLYRSGKLDEKQQSLVLANRSKITKTHRDKVEKTNHIDIDRSKSYAIHPSDCQHIDDSDRSHKDTGIGVEFPV